ncbi:MAG: metal-dependent hydrolase [Vicingaceae bacterium]
MDSITQIVLGAAVGEAVIGKKVGRWAPLWGAVAGTIPDLDVFVSYFTDNITALEIHRGFTHSFIFSVLFGLLFGFLVSKIHYKLSASWKEWSLLFFLGFLTHAWLDAHTTWGTQVFWPIDYKVAFKNIFVIDPLYTIPFLVFLLMAIFHKKGSEKRRRYNNLGLIISSCYMVITLGLKGLSHNKFTSSLEKQEINYINISTRPTPLNTILWAANIQLEDGFLIGYFSFFDSKEIQFSKKIPKNNDLLAPYMNEKKVQQLIKLTDGWYALEAKGDKIIFKDLRFGQNDITDINSDFVFSFELFYDENGVFQATELPKDITDGKKMFTALIKRVGGN